MLIAANPFVNAYLQSDWFGKGIFFALFALSVISWTVIVIKAWQIFQIRKTSSDFAQLFIEQKQQPLHFQFQRPPQQNVVQPFFEVYKAAKQTALPILGETERLAPMDVDRIEMQTSLCASSQYKSLESHLFILSTVVTLGPFLGLLGTVWGILLTFAELPNGFSSSNTAMLSGLSMALATTVIGLVVAIPALVGYNYLKNAHKEYRRDLETFANQLLTAIETRYCGG